MNNLKFRYIFQHIATGKITISYFTLEEIENGISFNLLFPAGYEIINRDLYIGLKDKNNNEIYPGDIFLMPDKDKTGISHSFASGRKNIIIFKKGSFISEELPSKKDCICRINNIYDVIKNNNIEIIGNIYENPELLRKDNVY